MTSGLNSWLIFFAASAPTTALILLLVLNHRERTKWMKIFCAKLEIPTTIMDDSPEREVVNVPDPKDKRKRIAVPIPGAAMWRAASSTTGKVS